MFTGGFEKMSRLEAKSLAEDNGAKFWLSYKKAGLSCYRKFKTNEEKIDKAKELKIKTMTESDWYKALNR